MKHLLTFLLLLLALLTPATANAHDFEVDGIYYNINGTNATVTYRGAYSSQYSNEYSGSVTIPSTVTYNGITYSVTAIGYYAFYGCSGLTSVTIPNSVTTVGEKAFYGCSGLTSVTIPNSVTTIGYSAFNGCSGLTGVTIPNSVTAIGNYTFYGCSGLTSVTIPNSVTTIGEEAFYGCSGLTRVTIPNSVTTIGKEAFYGCSGLTRVTIPNSVTTIGKEAFYGCSGLTSISVANENTAYDSRNNCNAVIETASNTLIAGCQNTIIPNSITVIDDGAFGGCSGLTNVTIPNSVTSIGDRAFSDCSGLTNVTIPNSVTAIGDWAFSGCCGLTNVVIPISVNTIGEWAFSGTAWLDNQPDGLVYAGLVAYTFKGTMPDGTSITIKDGTLGIAGSAFTHCHGLTNVTIPNSVTTIGGYAFEDCERLESITIPNSVTTIGASAFSGCSGLRSLNIGNSVTTIGESAFATCMCLTSVTIPNSVTSIGQCAFFGCRSMTNISIGSSVKDIGEYAFWDCSSLTAITIPKSVKSIGHFLFHGCSSLSNVIVDSENTTFDSRDNCNAIIETSSNTLIAACRNTVIPNTVISIGFCAFTGINVPLSITIPNSVTTIDEGAFCECYGLTSVSIPNSVISIGYGAFEGCSNLTDVYSYITDLTRVTVGGSAFSCDNYPHDYSGRTLHVPYGTTNSYQADSNWYPYFGQILEMPAIANSIELNNYVAVVLENESLQLNATMQPENTLKDLAWSSSNPAVATVDDDGLVTAHSVGTATITVMTTDGSNLSASCVVTVKSLSATECFSMPDGEVLHGESITIPVRMNNEATVLAFQTDIFLPEGFSLAADGDDEPMVMPTDRLTSDHLIVTETVSSGAVRVVCYTPSMQPISGNEGDLFYITVNVPDDAAGDYAIYLRNSRLTTDDFNEVRIPDAGAVINVKTYIPGDVNNTHTVNVADIVTTVRYVMEQNPTPFIFDAADMNGDGEVTVTDIMLIARLIMYPTMNAPRHAPAMVANGDRMSGEDIALTTGETRTVSINLDNEAQYSEGITASNFCLTDRAASHALEVNTLTNGTIRTLCYTPTIEAIDGTSGAVLAFDVTATSPVTGDITVDGIELVTTGCQTVKPAVFNIGVQTETAVNELQTGKTVAKVEYFNLAGQRLTRPANGVTLIVTTYTDGTRTTTKLLH